LKDNGDNDLAIMLLDELGDEPEAQLDDAVVARALRKAKRLIHSGNFDQKAFDEVMIELRAGIPPEHDYLFEEHRSELGAKIQS